MPPIMSLHSLFGDGGLVPGVDVVVMRIYPILVCITVKLYYCITFLPHLLLRYSGDHISKCLLIFWFVCTTCVKK